MNLQLESLCQISEAKQDHLVKSELRKMPIGLDETYFRILERIERQVPTYMRDLAVNSLMWVVHAKEPLYTPALQDALATDRFGQSEQDAILDEADVILKACCGLLEETYGTIRLIHFSVQEFFTNLVHKSADGGIWSSIANPTSAHEKLSRICLMSLRLAPSSRLSPPHGLYSIAPYAVQFFDHHLFECGAPENVSQLVDDVLS